MPLLTVCLPTYNRASLLNVVLEHLIAQILPEHDIEIIVSDNASEDNTAAVVKSYQGRLPGIIYRRNARNVGMDENTFLTLEAASGEYVWLLSDDDIPLPGSVSEIVERLESESYSLVYLNVGGYWPGEHYDIVRTRGSDLPNKTFSDPQRVLQSITIAHFSAIIMKRESALRFIDTVRSYGQKGFTRGYVVNLAHYVLLSSREPCLFIGKIALACRNPEDGNNYNPITTLTDSARQYQLLREAGLVSKKTEHIVINRLVEGFYTLVVPRRCKRDPYCSRAVLVEVHERCSHYRNYWIYLFPFAFMPLWLLRPIYLLARTARRAYRKILNTETQLAS